MKTNQPVWKLVANLGDKNPIDHGGYFIYEDLTGVYAPEAEILISPEEEGKGNWYIHRFSLEKHTLDEKLVDGLDASILSDNPYHPECPAWFAQPESRKKTRPQDTTYLSNVAACCGQTLEELRKAFCADNVLGRAFAYQCLGDYHGFDNLDHNPIIYVDREDVELHYAKKNAPSGVYTSGSSAPIHTGTLQECRAFVEGRNIERVHGGLQPVNFEIK